MARVRILQGVAGSDFSWTPGEVVDLPTEEAAKWADGTRGEWADGPPSGGGVSAVTSGGGETASAGGDAPLAGGGDVFDPSAHSVAAVLAHLATAGEQEALRVLDAEAAGKNRAGIAKERDALLAQAHASGEQQGGEKAAEQSRGGGRGGTPETR